MTRAVSKRERLQKYIANCGYCSRRKAELLITHGLVHVNGVPVRELGHKIAPDTDRVVINGETIAPPPRVTVALNKPAGFITSTHDTHERLTVMDLLPRTLVIQGLRPVGRLDLETEGLLLLTNDGDLLHRITHPRYSCSKEYVALLSREPKPQELEKMRGGVYLKEVGKQTQPAQIDIERTDDGVRARVIIEEGMKRQVRRTFEVVGIDVLHLERTRIGPVTLSDLPRGSHRTVAPAELEALSAEATE